MNDNVPQIIEATAVESRQFFKMEPREQVAYATEMATVLSDIIRKQKLYTTIQGKDYVRLEGWQTLGTFLGIIPKERSVIRQNDGSYEAFVDLIKFSDGTVVGGGSALCSINEKRWGNADEYARRSMAITRATGKAFRSAFSWIITLAGYEPTPEEEIPREAPAAPKTNGGSAAAHGLKSEVKTEIYIASKAQQEKIIAHLRDGKHPADMSPLVEELLMNKPFSYANVGAAIYNAAKKYREMHNEHA